MNRRKFMQELAKKLRRLPDGERRSALAYYDEYFDEAGADNEQRVIDELGSPSEVAAQIISEFAYKNVGRGGKKAHRTRVLGIVLLGIFASPIALPIAVALFVVLLVLIVAVFVVLVSLAASAAALVCSGAVTAVMSFGVLFHDPATMIFFLGAGLVALTGGGALGIGVFWLSKHSIRGLTRLIAKLVKRGGRA